MQVKGPLTRTRTSQTFISNGPFTSLLGITYPTLHHAGKDTCNPLLPHFVTSLQLGYKWCVSQGYMCPYEPVARAIREHDTSRKNIQT